MEGRCFSRTKFPSLREGNGSVATIATEDTDSKLFATSFLDSIMNAALSLVGL